MEEDPDLDFSWFFNPENHILPPDFTGPFALLELPNELLLMIAEDFTTRDLKSLLQTNRRFASLLRPRLHSIAAQEKDGMPALQWAVINWFNHMAVVMLERGVDINAQDPIAGKTALHEAAEHDNVAMVRLLLDKGADVNVKTHFGESALHWAAVDGYFEIVKLLLESGVDVGIRNNNGETAMMLALSDTGFYRWRYYCEGDVVGLLLGDGRVNVGFPGVDECIVVRWRSLTIVVRMLLEKGVDILDLDTEGQWFCREVGDVCGIRVGK